VIFFWPCNFLDFSENVFFLHQFFVQLFDFFFVEIVRVKICSWENKKKFAVEENHKKARGSKFGRVQKISKPEVQTPGLRCRCRARYVLQARNVHLDILSVSLKNRYCDCTVELVFPGDRGMG
jgi:hypothetical protein